MGWQSHHAEDISGTGFTTSVGFREEDHDEVCVEWGTQLLHSVAVLLKGLTRPSSGIVKCSSGWISLTPTADSHELARAEYSLTKRFLHTYPNERQRTTASSEGWLHVDLKKSLHLLFQNVKRM